ncbi:MAG: rRNA maturation RNase YbeY [Bacteroidetes bacterium]|nr:MAG: rRNA maturation RNase YbeY [Bacteroidota bacterium]
MISFVFEDISPIRGLKKKVFKEFVVEMIHEEGFQSGDLSFVFCSDEFLLDVNRKYLNHDYYTDIITFDYSEKQVVSGDMMISVDRTKENAFDEGVDQMTELSRVMIHGVLHLCGYKDKSDLEEKEMRSKENHYLKKLKDKY